MPCGVLWRQVAYGSERMQSGAGDRDHVQSIADGRLEPDAAVLQEMPRSRQASILDTAYDRLRYEYLAKQVTEDASRGLSRRILVARARVGTFEPGEESGAVEL